MNTEEKIFANLQKIGLLNNDGQRQFGDYAKLESGGYMPLSLDFLYDEDEKYVIAMAHYGEQNGDLMADPDMEIEITPATCSARAMTYRNDYVGVSQDVQYQPHLQKDLNDFLHMWTKNIIDQGFAYSKGDTGAK